MIPARVDNLFIAGCLSIAGLCAMVLRLLDNKNSWLSRRVDGAVTLPATSPQQLGGWR